MRRRALAVSALILFGVGCGDRAHTQTEKPKQYELRGVVVRLSSDTNIASIRGEKVEGWMDAMTMQYPVEDKKEYLALHKGEKIIATVNVTSEGYWLSNVRARKD